MARLSAGDRIAGRYEIRALTGDRPLGLTYRGFDEQIGVEVALRVIDDNLLVDESERAAFAHKARRAKTLQHPNLIRLYDVLVDDAAVLLVMQWAPGARLSSRSLSSDEARLVVRRVADGVSYANKHGVVLGNLRADTVILYDDGLKLTNVGIGAALPRERFLSAMAARDALSELAPEVQRGGDVDERTDVYGLARLARQLLGNDVASALWPRALSDDPDDRPRDVDTFMRELESRGVSAVRLAETGSDTDRVEKLNDALIVKPANDPIELDESMIEEPDVTNVGKKPKAERESTPSPKAPTIDDIPMLPSRPRVHEEEEHATFRREKLEREHALPAAPPIWPDAVAAPPPAKPTGMLLPLIALCAVLLGAVSVLAMHVATNRPPQPRVVVTTAPPPAAMPRPEPRSRPSPAPRAFTPTPVAQDNGCAPGMSRLVTPHAYCIDTYEYPGAKAQPRTNVSFAEATAICASRNLRLCSDQEWEQACRGPQQASYPWGQSFDAKRCNESGEILPAGTSTRCRSASGAYDMSGNVAEWSASGSLRGGSALGPAENTRCSHAIHGANREGANDVGFRCCGAPTF